MRGVDDAGDADLLREARGHRVDGMGERVGQCHGAVAAAAIVGGCPAADIDGTVLAHVPGREAVLERRKIDERRRAWVARLNTLES